MGVDEPTVRRCCFCVSLRCGLLLWSYLVLIITLLLVLGDSLDFILYYDEDDINWASVFEFGLGLLILLGIYMFTLLLINATHNKSIRLLRIYKVAGQVLAFLDLFWVICVSGRAITSDVGPEHDSGQPWTFYTWIRFSTRIVYFVMQLYIVSVVKSKISKLEDESHRRFEFSNLVVELEGSGREMETIEIHVQNGTECEDAEKKFDREVIEEKLA